MKQIKTRKLHLYHEPTTTTPSTISYAQNTDQDTSQSNYHQPEYNTSSSNNINLATTIILVIIVSLLSGSIGAYFVISSKGTTSLTENDGIIRSNAILNETNSIADAVEKVYDTVVVVEVYSEKNELISTGTGFVYKKSGNKAYLMTNNHVISGGHTIKVLFTDGTELETEIIGSDTYSDIAVLAVKDNDKISSATLGDSTNSKVGDTVFTVGSPEGSDYAGTVTKGILSAKDRLVAVALENSQTSDYYMQVLQTDAAINPGNSGGPICNTNGEVIGITNMKLVDDTVEGMGFAIPVEEALKVAEILEKDGQITRPKLGVNIATINNRIELYYQSGILVPNDVNEGLVIVSVEPDTPAAKGGLIKGDIITKINQTKTSDLADFRYELYKHNPGEEITITYLRDGEEQTTKLTLG